MAQFRVEFVLDQVSGKYLAEMYHPERGDELLLRTEALYPSQEAAVLGVVQLFKNAILKFPQPGEPPKIRSRQNAAKAKKPRRVKKTNKGKKTNKARKAKAARSKKRK